VTPVDAQKLALGERVGSLSLVLRKPGTTEDDPFVQTVSLNDLRYGRYGATYAQPVSMQTAAPVRVTRTTAPRPRPVSRPKPAAPAPKPTNNVDVVRGTTATSYDVGDYRG
jgi:pilus assembly protein CpaB